MLFIPPVRLATMHALDALLLSPHARPPLPHAPLWDRGDGVTGPLYPEVPAGQEHPPRLLLSTPDATPPNAPDLTTIPHLRIAERDPLLPYAAGIHGGVPYIRVHDLPAWVHYLRRAPGNDWPDDGATLWVQDRRLATWYRENPDTAIRVTGARVDLDQPVIVFGEHATYNGKPLYRVQSAQVNLAAGAWRDVFSAVLDAREATVTRHYLDGRVIPEGRTLGVVDVVTQVTPASITTEFAYQRVDPDIGISDVGFAAQVTATLTPEPTQPNPGVAYVITPGHLTPDGPAPTDGPYRLITSRAIPEWSVTSVPGAPTSGDKLTPLSLPPRTIRARFIPGADGLPLSDARDAPPQALLTGALVYEGPLGTLPAPCSGVNATWAGLEVSAGGHFTADAWVDGATLWACLVDASGQVQVARQTLSPPPDETAQMRRWTYPAAGLPAGTPVLTYSFLREGQATPDGAPRWPTRAGLLAWVAADGALTRVSVRTRRGGDATPGGQPVTFEVWPDLPASPDHRAVTLTRPGTLAPPDAATLGGEPAPLLPRWQAPAPGEPGGTRPALAGVTGALTLTWADPTGTGRARIAALTFLTSRAAARTLPDRLTRPGGWTFDTRPAGPYVRVTLTPPTPAPLSVTVLCQSLPVGHPRATLEATPDEN